MAKTLTVDPTDATCGTTSNPDCRTTITAALIAAVASDSIEVAPGTYHERITLRSDIAVSLRGRETARTILTGDGTGTIITATGVPTTSISGFTFTSALVGIDVSSNSTLTLVNNVFATGLGGIGVRVQNTTPSLVTIRNSTFYQNLTAVSNSTTVMTIMNNIFANNTTAISSTDIATTNITYNCFFGNVTDGKIGDILTNVTGNPLFVSPAILDFHLKEGSPCIDAGDPNPLQNDIIDNTSRNDMGAYGGPNSDTIPYPVSLSSAPTSTGDTITLSWAANLSSVVTSTVPARQGGYNIYYSILQSGQSGTAYQNKLTLASTATSTVISGLTTSIAPAGAPVLNPLGFDNQTLLVSWPSVSGATGYKVHYALSTDLTNSLHTAVIQDTSYKLVSLINGTNYTVWVTAVAQPKYFLAVTAFDYKGPYDPGISHESAYSAETSVLLGSPVESAPSNTRSEFPEPFVYNPNLPNKGCFIATAAYGYYDAPQVQALRDFRDRYLETNSAGRAFVRWYYEYGPIGAAALNEHPWLKPVVRTALMPAVGGALFLTRVSTVTQLLVLFLFILMTAMLVMYKKGVRRGGSR
jgi:hypothetical protein